LHITRDGSDADVVTSRRLVAEKWPALARTLGAAQVDELHESYGEHAHHNITSHPSFFSAACQCATRPTTDAWPIAGFQTPPTPPTPPLHLGVRT